MNQGRDPSIFLTSEKAPPSATSPTEVGHSSWIGRSRSGDQTRIDRGNSGRRGWLFALGICLSLAAVVAATGWLGTARKWLADRPDYQIPWNQIQLEPAPPAYIRAGTTPVLAGVKKRLGGPESISTLAQDWAELARALSLGSPWVEEVHKIAVSGYPNKLVINLSYRHPIAMLNAGGNAGSKIILDKNGVVLPSDDIDLKEAGSLIRIDGLSGALEPRPGLALTTAGSQDETKLQAAIGLANFVRAQTEAQSPNSAKPLLQAVNLRYGDHHLFAQTRDGLWVLWGDAPEQEPAGQLRAQQKWSFLKDWLANHAPVADRPGSYLVFTPTGATLQAAKSPGTGRKADASDSGG